MTPKLCAARHAGEYRIHLMFEDGTAGEIDLSDELWGEMFEPLRDPDRFSAFRVDPELNTLVWPNGADLAPEFLFERVAG